MRLVVLWFGGCVARHVSRRFAIYSPELPLMKKPEDPASNTSATPTFDLHDAIRQRAEEIYFESGGIPGRDQENWAQAEREIRARHAQKSSRNAIVVKVHGVKYVGEYAPETSDGYVPGEFAPGEGVPVVIEGNRMLVHRSNGRVLETRIVKTIG